MPKRPSKRKPVKRARRGALGLAPPKSKAGLLGFAAGGVIPGHGIGAGKILTAAAPKARPAKKPAPAAVLPSESDLLNQAEARRVRVRAAGKVTDRGLLG